MPATAPAAEPTDPAAAALRASLIGDRVTIKQAAAALNVTDRSVYNAITQHNIPFVLVFGVRYLSPAALRSALVRETTREPRRPGRPRKAA